MAGNRRWTEEEKKILKGHFQGIASKELTRAFEERSERSVRSMATRLGLVKSPERLQEAARQHGFGKNRQAPPSPDSAA